MNTRHLTVGELVEDGYAEIRTGPFGTQLRASEYSEHGVPVLNVRNLGYGAIREAQLEHVPEVVAERLATHLLDVGDIVFGRKGAVDRHVLIGPDQKGWMQGSDCIRLRVGSRSPVGPEFLSKLFLTPQHKQWMAAQGSHGATMASLNQEIISRIPIDTPCSQAQSRIVGVLAALDDAIGIHERCIGILENLARSLYREWFVHFRPPGHRKSELTNSRRGPIPKGWSVRHLSDLAEVIVEGVDPSECEAGERYVGLEHLSRRSTTLRNWGSVGSVTSRKLRFERGDTLFGKIRPNLHKVAWAPSSGLASSDTMIFRALGAEPLTALLNSALSSDRVVAEAVATANGTKMPRANPKVLLEQSIVAPGDELLSTFEATVRPWLEWSAELVELNERLSATRDLLLPRLVTGQLDISDIDLGVLTPLEPD